MGECGLRSDLQAGDHMLGAQTTIVLHDLGGPKSWHFSE